MKKLFFRLGKLLVEGTFNFFDTCFPVGSKRAKVLEWAPILIIISVLGVNVIRGFLVQPVLVGISVVLFAVFIGSIWTYFYVSGKQ